MNLFNAFILIVTKAAYTHANFYKNDTEAIISDVLEAVEALESAEKGEEIVVITKEFPDDLNNTSSDKSEYEENPIIRNILRVPIHYKTSKKGRDYAQKQLDEIVAKEKRKLEKAENEHRKRMEKVIEVMTQNYWTNLYLYGEVGRILRTRTVKDDLRLMIEALETGAEHDIKKKVIDCFKIGKNEIIREKKFWDKSTNNMIIHTLLDPYNDGVHN